MKEKLFIEDIKKIAKDIEDSATEHPIAKVYFYVPFGQVVVEYPLPKGMDGIKPAQPSEENTSDRI